MEHATPGHTPHYVSVTEAARELGISPETVRRRIKSGLIKARRAIRPQGTVWEVSLPLATPRSVPPVTPVTGHSAASPSEPAHTSPDEALHPSPGLARQTDGAAHLVASIARLIVELAEVRVISDRRADQLVSQAETIGRLMAELAASEARGAALVVSRATEQPDSSTGGGGRPEPFPALLPPHPNWWDSVRTCMPWLLLAAILLLAFAVGQPTWVR